MYVAIILVMLGVAAYLTYKSDRHATVYSSPRNEIATRRRQVIEAESLELAIATSFARQRGMYEDYIAYRFIRQAANDARNDWRSC